MTEKLKQWIPDSAIDKEPQEVHGRITMISFTDLVSTGKLNGSFFSLGRRKEKNASEPDRPIILISDLFRYPKPFAFFPMVL